MKKQKICVIGDGLSGLTAALALSNLDIEVDFIIKNIQEKKTSDPRISQNGPRIVLLNLALIFESASSYHNSIFNNDW